MTNRSRTPLPAMLAALAAVLPLMATARTQNQAQAPAARPDDVVVVARAKGDADKQIGDFVRALTPPSTGNDPLTRFDVEKPCPLALGLTAPYDAAITERMRRVAGAAGMPLAAANCRSANALAIFVDDKTTALAWLGKHYPWLFVDRHGDRIHPRQEEGPAVAWHIDEPVDRDGVAMVRGESGFYESRTATQQSRAQASARLVFVLSIVLVERRGVAGLTVTQIADYAAMRLFADARPPRADAAPAAPTILSVLSAPMGGETPLSMTAWDLGFLRGLYAAPPNSFAGAQRGAIRRVVKQQIEPSTGAQK